MMNARPALIENEVVTTDVAFVVLVGYEDGEVGR